MARLHGRVCIVTGSAQGIGYAIAERYLEEGAIVAIADIDDSGAKEAADVLAKAYPADGPEPRVAGFHVDISDVNSTEQLVEEVVARFGPVDVLVNNAGIYRGIVLNDITPEYLDRVIQVNLIGTWKMSRAVVPSMLGQGRGRIIVIGSDAAYNYDATLWPTVEALPNFSYALSKWSLHGLTKYMAGTLGPRGINVNCIAPGVVLTEATNEALSADMIKGMALSVPLRKSIQPADLTGTAVFFASNDADLVTGQVLCVDGGMSMPA